MVTFTPGAFRDELRRSQNEVMGEWITMRQAEILSGLSDTTIKRRMNEGKVERRNGYRNAYMVKRSDIEQLRTRHGQHLLKPCQSEFGRLLRKFRIYRQINQQELAQRIGVPKNVLSKWERGGSRPPIWQIKRICEELEAGDKVRLMLYDASASGAD